MKPIIILALSLPLLLLSSCFGGSCSDRRLALQYRDFTPDQLSTAIVRKYEPGSNFTKLVQSDTDKLPGSRKYITLSEEYEWEVLLPLVGHTDRVKDIEHTKKSQRRVLPSGGSSYDCCYNGISYNYNGVDMALGRLTEADCGGRMEYITVRKSSKSPGIPGLYLVSY